MMTESKINKARKVRQDLRNLRLSLKYRPDIMKLILKMRLCITRKNALLTKLKKQLKETKSKLTSNYSTNSCLNIKKGVNAEKDSPTCNNLSENTNTIRAEVATVDSTRQTKDTSTQTDNQDKAATDTPKDVKETEWNINDKEQGKSIAEQVKEVAQSALQQSGMVYVESAGMYYDYKTGYYYNPELGLYYHPDTGCYYCYSDDKQSFVFHSYPDRSAQIQNPALVAHNKRKAKKHKSEKKKEDDIENLTKNLSQENGASKRKKRKFQKKPESHTEPCDKDTKIENLVENQDKKSPEVENKHSHSLEMEDGECSDTDSEKSNEDVDDSTSSESDNESVARHHPPCMRVIVRETNLPKLKVGSLFLITKDGGTLGREGEHHTILIRDHNISRTHLDIKYDMDKSAYVITDLGSKNGTILNGTRMSESQEVSKPMQVLHGSTIQLGETKLLCHIHPGNDTCGHCEPGLLMETQEKEKKVAYTRTCSIQKQHELELARLKNKYAPKPLMIEEREYNDRAQARREAVGSSHQSEKTHSSDLDTFIAPENKGFKLLEKMGWSKGEGLGKDNQGDVEPVPLVSNEGTSGLGTSGNFKQPETRAKKVRSYNLIRLTSRTKMLERPAQAFLVDDEEDEYSEKIDGLLDN